MPKTAFSLLIPVACLMSGNGIAQVDNPDPATSAVAGSWLGHDAGELLKKWPIDKGFDTSEDEKTGETSYTFYFGNNAYSYNEDIMSGPHPVGNDGAGNLIMRDEVIGTNHIEVPKEDHCQITFYANDQGIISRYAYNGVKCRPYAKSWGRPKKR